MSQTVGIVLTLLACAAGVAASLWWERKYPSSYTRRASSYSRRGVPVDLSDEGPSPDEWAAMPTAEQEAWDTEALDTAEQAELDAEDDAREAAEFLAHRAQANALFHP